MNIEYKDFIGVFTDVFPEGFCEHMVSEFERFNSIGAGNSRQKSEDISKLLKTDTQIFNGNNLDFLPFNERNTIDIFFDGLQKCFLAYSNEYAALKDIQISCKNMKLQRTSSGEGYHLWHSEQGNDRNSNRGLVYMLYLNTLPLEANGETEFLYQQRRISPVGNTMVLWPAAFTHTHRGNPVYGDNCKYIITGWFYHE